MKTMHNSISQNCLNNKSDNKILNTPSKYIHPTLQSSHPRTTLNKQITCFSCILTQHPNSPLCKKCPHDTKQWQSMTLRQHPSILLMKYFLFIYLQFFIFKGQMENYHQTLVLYFHKLVRMLFKFCAINIKDI